MIALGFDAGAHLGWSALFLAPARAPAVLGRGVIEVGEGADAALDRVNGLLGEHHAVAVVGLELPGDVFPVERRGEKGIAAKMASALKEAAYLAGRVHELARVHGARVVRADALTVRRAFIGGRGTPTDAQVKSWLRATVPGWPVKSNTHERDAAAVALYAVERVRRAGA